VTVSSKAKNLSNSNKIIFTEEDPLSEPPLEGGPKVAELLEDFVDSRRLIKELNINPELPDSQRKNSKMLLLEIKGLLVWTIV